MTTTVLIVSVVALTVAGIGSYLGYRWRKEREEILSLQVVPAHSAAPTSNIVVVHGRARGEVCASPWTGRDGLYFEAVEVERYQQRKGDGSTETQTRHRPLGNHFKSFGLGNEQSRMLVLIEVPEKVDLRHLPSMETGSSGSAGAGITINGIGFGNSPRSHIEETFISDGDEIWVIGTVTVNQDGMPTVSAEKLIISGRDPQGMASSLNRKALVAFLVATAGLVTAICVAVASLS